MVTNGILPPYPQLWSSSQLDKDDREKFLSPKLLAIFSKRLEEAQSPDSEKVYCPYSNCSALMALSTWERCLVENPDSSSSTNSFTTTKTKCQRCNRLFCIECRVPWQLAQRHDMRRLCLSVVWRKRRVVEWCKCRVEFACREQRLEDVPEL